MDSMSEQRVARVGDEVVGSDEGKIGKVAALDEHFLTVEKGLLRKEEFYVPMDAVNSCADGRVYLNVSKDDAMHQGWDVPPMMGTEADGRPVV